MLSTLVSIISRAASTFFAVFRTVVFYSAFAVWTVFWATLMIIFIYPFRFKLRHKLFVQTWTKVSLNLCRFIAGVRWVVKGQENIPQSACVIISNHQSTWETLFLQTMLTPQSQVIKQELLKIPFFGWAFTKIKPIAINRNDPRQALQQVREQGKAALAHNVWVLIFPEGTRVEPDTLGKFSRGAAGLAKAANVGILPVAHNAGTFWPNNAWIKTPGTIEVTIGPMIHTEELSVAEINNQSRQWIAQTLNIVEHT